MADALVQKLEQARTSIAADKLGTAVGALGDVVVATQDPELLRQALQLAEEGLAKAGRFGKGPWKSVISQAEKRLAAGG